LVHLAAPLRPSADCNIWRSSGGQQVKRCQTPLVNRSVSRLNVGRVRVDWARPFGPWTPGVMTRILRRGPVGEPA